jgi:hypothetical protein
LADADAGKAYLAILALTKTPKETGLFRFKLRNPANLSYSGRR